MYKGVVFNVISSILFVVSGYLIHYVLGTAMTPAQYGVVGSIITILDFEYLFLNNGVRQSLSKEISKAKYDTLDLIRKSLIFQMVLILLMFTVNFFGAGLMSEILKDASVRRYLMMAAFLIPINGLYVMTIGINEGFGKFVSGATIGIVYAVFKMSTIIYVKLIFDDPISATVTGFFTGLSAALVTGLITLFLIREQIKVRREEKLPAGTYIKNTLNFSVFFIIVSVVLSVDTLIVKSIETNKDMAGYYTGAINFAKVSYFVLSAFFTIILPTVTKYYTAGKIEKVKETIRMMFTIILSIVLPITMIISSSGKALLVAFYGEEYRQAGNVLAVLAVSHFLMGITVMFNMIISAANKRKFSSILAVCMVMLDLGLCILLTRIYSIRGTAAAGLICIIIAMTASGVYMTLIFDHVIVRSHLKLVIFNLVLWGVSRLLFELAGIRQIILLGLVYMTLYFAGIGMMQLLHLIDLKELIRQFKR